MADSFRKIGDYISVIDNRNSDGSITNLLGLSIEKCYIPSVANVIGTDLNNYKVIRKGQFACSLMQVSRDQKIPIALYNDEKPAIMSPAYEMFEVSRPDELLPEYMELWFKRAEFDREASFYAVGGVRGSLDWDDFCRMELPVPPLPEQRKIVHDYQVITDRIELLRKINENLIAQICMKYQMMLGRLTEENDEDELPPGWSIGGIGSYCDLKSGYAFKSEWWTDRGYKVIKIANITGNTIDLDSCDCVTEEHASLAKLFFCNPGDIFIALTGATTGKIGILPFCKDKVVVNQRVGKFFLGQEPLKKAPFLFATLLSPRLTRRLQPGGMAGSAQDNLSPDDIKNMAVLKPDAQTIENFNEQNRNIIENLMTNLSELRLLKGFSVLLLSRMTLLSRGA